MARFNREREQLALRLDEQIRASLSDDRIPPITDALEEVYGEFAIGEYPETREMRFFLGDVAAFTPGLIARLRRLVRDEFPKWTVVPQFEECSFVVAAGGVVFGDAWIRDPITEGNDILQKWLAKAREIDEAKYGPYRRQLRWLKPRIPAALALLPAEAVVLLGVFERLRYDGRAVWVLLLPTEHGGGGVLVSSTGREAQSQLGHYPVDAQGVIYPQFTSRFNPLSDERPAAWLKAYLSSVPLPGTLDFYSHEKQYFADGRSAGAKLGSIIKRIEVPAPLNDLKMTSEGHS